ncbi:fibropellin-2 isoform X3 [Strongylocentrotus purpuratus]|uniref:EGF-like domain-containing protein n=1 Tax=Strongylocentrotus purpuratus TaxID=7668 RepID=A0A7M7NUC2_STRPU|nr:fibropellin-2 isoform X3 [Strongylocentrotus purpuratus]
MKFNLAFVVAFIGVGMVAADENLMSKLQMALKSMLNENEELQMQSRDTKGQCESDTNKCNNHGTCTEGRWGTYYCKCVMPYRVRGADSSCYPIETREQVARTYPSFRQCIQETNYCDGHGGCLPGPRDSDGRFWFSCKCGEGYDGNNKGGCSPIVLETREEVEMLARKYYSLSECSQGTNDCNENGECVEKDGKYWCECGEGYEENEDGGCSLLETREEVEMLARKYYSLSECSQGTNDCNENGECVEKDGKYWCECGEGYEENEDGGCSPIVLETREEVEMLARKYYSLSECSQGTNDCNENGECVEKDGKYWCKCGEDYEENEDGGCSPIETREEVEMLARKYYSLSDCSQGTNDCNENGECVEEDGKYWCKCGEDYEENEDGGCSPIVTRATEVDDDDFAERKKEIMRQLAEFLQEE